MIKKQRAKTKILDGKKTSIKQPPIVESMIVDLEVLNSLTSLFQKANVPDPASLFEFSPDYKLDVGEWYYIKNYELPNIIGSCLSNPRSVATYSPSDVLDINCIFIGSSDMTRIAFKKIENKEYVSKAKLNLIHDGQTFKRNKRSGFILDDSIDFFFVEGTLYFRTFSKVNSILDIEKYYEIATDEGVDSFIADEHLTISDVKAFKSFLDRPMKRQILLIQKRGIFDMDTVELKKMADAKGYNLVVHDGKIVMPTDKKEIKILMGFLAGKVFQDDITKDLLYANSVARISK